MPSNDTPPLVQGEIILPKELGSFNDATVNIYLEDISLQDAPAKIVAQSAIAGVSHSRGTENRVEFALQGEIEDIQANYSVRVHITFHRDEQIHLGDYISTQSYPVLTYGYPDRVSIRVTEVK
ncbi:MAG: YbaY family lipoprotein [Pleurocapsa sp. MO_192.B19]|nr:YbaY family lipoprotein [Pleurocapsa sp. MO_192.B19]